MGLTGVGVDLLSCIVLPNSSTLVLLFALRLPFAIAWVVPLVIVLAANAVAFSGTLAHVLEEAAEVSPPFADFDTTSEVVSEMGTVGVVLSSSDHGCPRFVSGGTCHSMLLAFCQFALKPATGAGIQMVRGWCAEMDRGASTLQRRSWPLQIDHAGRGLCRV